jgi:hypothetical protein
MLEELLKKRAYLSGERAAIEQRLKEFMGVE